MCTGENANNKLEKRKRDKMMVIERDKGRKIDRVRVSAFVVCACMSMCKYVTMSQSKCVYVFAYGCVSVCLHVCVCVYV